MSNATGVGQLYGWELATGALHQVTHRPAGTVTGTISQDGRWILYLDDRKGDELGHWVRVPFAGGPQEDLTPRLPLYTSDDLVTNTPSRLVAFTAAMDDGFTVFLIGDEASDEEPRAIYRSRSLCSVEDFDARGERLLVLSSERTSRARYSALVLGTQDGEQLAELWDGEECSIGRPIFSPLADDPRICAVSDRSGDRRPLLWDPTSGEREDLPVGDSGGEVLLWDWSPDGRELLLCRIRDAVQGIEVLDLVERRLRRLDHEPGTYGYYGEVGTWFGPEGDIVAQWQDAAHPATVRSLDRVSGRVRRALLPPSHVPPSRPWRSVTFPTDDGSPIQAWLAVPDGPGPHPAVIETHGGPESVTMESFQPRAQAWLDHGSCFLSINYRGSTTFGRAFKESIWGHPGDLEVADIVAGRAWLVAQGMARPDEVFLTGWSYGGFLTLQALGREPALWAGGMAGVAVADWVSEYEDENDVLRAFDRALFGGSPQERMEAYVRASPITYAERVDAPVLIIQGRNDTRCPARQVEDYEARMRALGKPVEVIWFDAGHAAGADVERAIEHQDAMLRFARHVLATRGR